MDPIRELDAFAGFMANAVAEAFVKVSLVAGCIGLTIVCGIALLARRKDG